MRSFPTPLSLGTAVVALALAGCSHTTPNPNLPTGLAAYKVIPVDSPELTRYLVRAGDVLNVQVFDEPGISNNALTVDEVGNVQIALAGEVRAAGRDVNELAKAITVRLGGMYLVNPQVTVSVKEMAPRFVSVEGEVQKPGVYEITKSTTLLSAIARAESPTRTARLDEIVIIRTIGKDRMYARFNLKDIRTGVGPDPEILDGDVIMVGFSTRRGFVEDLLRTAPLFNAWTRF